MLNEGKQAEMKFDITPYQRAIRQQLGLPSGFCRGGREINMRYLTPLDRTQFRKIFLEQFLKAAITRLKEMDSTFNAGCLRGQVSRARVSHNSPNIWAAFFIFLGILLLGSVVPAAIFKDELHTTYDMQVFNQTSGTYYNETETFYGEWFFYTLGPLGAMALWCVLAPKCIRKQEWQDAFVPSAHVRLNAKDDAILTKLAAFLKVMDDTVAGLDVGDGQLDAKGAEPPRNELPKQLIEKCQNHLAMLAQWDVVDTPVVADGKQGRPKFLSSSPSVRAPGLKTSESLMSAFNRSTSNYQALEDALIEPTDRAIPLSVSVQVNKIQTVPQARAVDQIYSKCKEEFFPTLGAASAAIVLVDAEEHDGIPQAHSINRGMNHGGGDQRG